MTLHTFILLNLLSKVQTIERASEFVQEFRQKKSIFKWLKRNDYKDDFQSLHEQVSQHVNDLTWYAS